MEKFLEGLNMCAKGTKAHGPLLFSIHGAKLKVDLSGSPLCLVRILDDFGDLCGMITHLLLLVSVPQFLATRLTWIKLVLLYIFHYGCFYQAFNQCQPFMPSRKRKGINL